MSKADHASADGVSDLAFNNWEVAPGPEEGTVLSHTSGRIEVAIEPVPANPGTGDGDGMEYPVNVYESTTFDRENREFIDHTLVKTVRVGASSQDPETYRDALTAAINAVLEIETEGTWLSQKNRAKEMFIRTSMSYSEAGERFRELIAESDTTAEELFERGEEAIISFADERGESELAAIAEKESVSGIAAFWTTYVVE